MYKWQHVNDVIRRLAHARTKDDLGDALFEVEEETGYTVDFIYDIFTEAVQDEDLTREEAEDPNVVLPIWDEVITTAYEFDY